MAFNKKPDLVPRWQAIKNELGHSQKKTTNRLRADCVSDAHLAGTPHPDLSQQTQLDSQPYLLVKVRSGSSQQVACLTSRPYEFRRNWEMTVSFFLATKKKKPIGRKAHRGGCDGISSLDVVTKNNPKEKKNNKKPQQPQQQDPKHTPKTPRTKQRKTPKHPQPKPKKNKAR